MTKRHGYGAFLDEYGNVIGEPRSLLWWVTPRDSHEFGIVFDQDFGMTVPKGAEVVAWALLDFNRAVMRWDRLEEPAKTGDLVRVLRDADMVRLAGGTELIATPAPPRKRWWHRK